MTINRPLPDTSVTRDTGDRWIPVTERLPEPLYDVLVAWSPVANPSPDEIAIDVAYRRRDQWVLSGSEPELDIKPTHWMPLPEPPKVEGDPKSCDA